jgi:hypothetical protein
MGSSRYSFWWSNPAGHLVVSGPGGVIVTVRVVVMRWRGHAACATHLTHPAVFQSSGSVSIGPTAVTTMGGCGEPLVPR